MIAESLIIAAENQFTAAPLDQPKPETLISDPHTKSLQAAAVVEDPRLIPLRPLTPFTATRSSNEFIEEEDEDVSLSACPCQDLVSV